MKGSSVRRVGPWSRAFAALCLFALAGALLAGVGARATGAQATGAKQKGAAGQAAGGKDALGRVRRARAGGDAKVNAVQKNADEPAIFGCANPDTPINIGATVNGTLQAGDCDHPDPNDTSFYDAYTFTGQGGQVVSIRLSAAFDAYLYLVGPGETAITYATVQNDDLSDATLDAGIFAILPATGTYTIMANSRFSGETGSYTLSVVSNCTAAGIASGSTVNGSLALNDCRLFDNSFVDVYSFPANAGQQVSISMVAQNFGGDPPNDTFLYLFGPDGFSVIATNDDSNDTTFSSRIPPGSGLGMLPATGTYYILANSFQPNTTGNYQLTMNLSATVCPATNITVGQTLQGGLTGTDCRLLQDGSFLDRYTFTGAAGQLVRITMTADPSTPALDTYLFLLDSRGIELAVADGGGGGTNARIPEVDLPGTGPFFRLPAAGTYTILANAAAPGLTGNYSLTVASNVACTFALTAPSRDVSSAGGTFNNTFTTQAGCSAPVVSNVPWITVNSSSVDATGAGTFNYTVAANTATTGRTGTITVGGQTFTVTQAAACAVQISPAVRPFSQAGGAGRLTVVPGSSCTWTAISSVPWITLNNPVSGTGTGRVSYTVAANTTSATRTGTITVGDRTHTVTQTSAATTPAVAFSNTGYSVSESDGTSSIRVSVSRVGSDLTGAATVEYRTIDNTAAVPCNPQETAERGTAYARCDYATTLDTLTFDAGQATKEFLIPLINDVHVEGNETFQIVLSNPQGATLGANTTATVTIQDDDTVQPTSNPIRQNNAAGFSFFVRQQYLDFLSREPDTDGFNAWFNVLNTCPNPDNLIETDVSAACDKIIVSKSFFESAEFEFKGRSVFLFHKAAFARNTATGVIDPNFVPEYEEIVSDMRRVTGATGVETIAKRLDFADDFTARPAFTARYNALSNAQYVDTLLANVGATLATADPNSGVTRNSLVADLTAGTKTRADVLRLIAEAKEVNDIQFRHAYVAMQYYGYLRRKPEPSGYQAWLDAISPPRNANPREMVNGFMNSREYRWRFGPDL